MRPLRWHTLSLQQDRRSSASRGTPACLQAYTLICGLLSRGMLGWPAPNLLEPLLLFLDCPTHARVQTAAPQSGATMSHTKRHRTICAKIGQGLPSYDSSCSFCSRALLLASSASTINTCRGSKGLLETEHLDRCVSIAGFGCEQRMQAAPAAHWGIPAGPRSSAPVSVLLTCGLLLPCCRPLQNVMPLLAAGLLPLAARTHHRSPLCFLKPCCRGA